MVGHIGRYEIRGKLGDGGFGSVYQAYDPTVQRVVAIKVLSNQPDASIVSRFHAEAKTAGRLNHKNIVTIYEFGEEEGTPFIVMQYLDGLDLQKIISDTGTRQSLTLLEKLEILSEAAQGLQCAHENGVVHRDVKPANIMRLKDGSVKIMDFGIARLTNAASTRLTQTGLMIGTVHYMAPEQFKSSDVDALCDIWAFGVVAYEFLTGIHPFRADDPAAVMYRVTLEEPTPLDSVLSECPPALTTNVHRLLAKNRLNRVQSLDDFLLDIEPVIEGLARTELPDLLKRAERLIDDDNLESAQSIVGRLQKLDRANKDVRRLKDRLRECARMQAARPRVEELLSEAAERIRSRDFTGAIGRLNSAIQLDPANASLRSRLERVKGEGNRAKRVDEALARGRRSMSEGDLTGAFAHFSEAVESEPDNAEGPVLLNAVTIAMRDREARARVRAGLEEANNLILIQSYDEAIAVLDDLSEKNGLDDQVERRLTEARQLQQAQKARDRLNASINTARELLKNGNYEEASRQLEALDHEYPNNPAIEVLLTHARERQKAEDLANRIGILLVQARGQRAAGRFDEALDCVGRALKLDPTNNKALGLQRIYLEEAQADYDRKKVEVGLERYRNLIREDKLEEALAEAKAIAEEHPGDERVAAAKTEAESRISERKEAQRLKLQGGIHEAERLLADGQPDSATKVLANLTVQYPAEAAVRDLLDRAQHLKLSQEAQERLNAGLISARQLLTRENLHDACQLLEDLSAKYPLNAAVEVLFAHAQERVRAVERSVQIEGFLAEAQHQREEGNIEQALQSVQHALEVDPENGKARDLNKALRDYWRTLREEGEIPAELQRVQTLLEHGDLEEARTTVDQLTIKFPQHRGISEVKQAVSGRIRQRVEQLADEIRQGIIESERLLARGRASAAIQLLEQLDRRFPDESSLAGPLERARQMEAEQSLREEIRTNVDALRELAARHDWTEAERLIASLLNQRPACREYIEQADNIERLKKCDRELSGVEAALKTGSLETAISLAEAAMAKFPGNLRAMTALQNARNARELKNLAAYARRRLGNGDLDEARQIVKDELTRFPDSAELRNLEKAIEKADRLNQSLNGAREALQNRRFAEARDLVSAILCTESDLGTSARHLLDQIDAQQKSYEKQLRYDRGRSEAENLLRTLQFDAAIETLRKLLNDFPEDNALSEDIDRAGATRDHHAKRERHTHGRAEAQKLFESSNLEAAIAALECLLQEFPDDPALLSDLAAVQSALVLREERRRMDSQIADLDILYRKGDAEAVRSGAKRILSRHKEPRASELLQWAEKSIAQGRQIRKKSRANQPVLLWGGGIAALAIIVAVWAVRGPDRHPQRRLDIQPEELAFSYGNNKLIPEASILHIRTDSAQEWRITNADPWLQIPSHKGTGTSDLNLRIDPSGLFPGTYTSFATVTSGDQQKTIKVRVTVSPKPDDKKGGQKVTMMTLISSRNPVSSGEGLTLTATLSPAVASGKVTFRDGSVVIGAGALSGGTASLGLSMVSGGAHSFAASYDGNADYSASKSSLSFLVKPVGTVTALTSTPNPSTSGQSVTVTASITPPGAPGAVTFFDGATTNVLGTEALKGGKATITLTTLSIGSHNLIATYGGDANRAGSTSSVAHAVLRTVDCGDGFTGTPREKITWRGEQVLSENEILTIVEKTAIPTGVVTGKLPGCPGTLAAPSGIEIITQPTAADGYRRLQVKNISGQPIKSITIQWDKKK
jgi:serine/threonine-protein kinase